MIVVCRNKDISTHHNHYTEFKGDSKKCGILFMIQKII